MTITRERAERCLELSKLPPTELAAKYLLLSERAARLARAVNNHFDRGLHGSADRLVTKVDELVAALAEPRPPTVRRVIRDSNGRVESVVESAMDGPA